MSQENAYAMKKKENKGCFRIACFRPLEAPVDSGDASEDSMKQSSPCFLSFCSLFKNSFFSHFQRVLAVRLSPSAQMNRLWKQSIPRSVFEVPQGMKFVTMTYYDNSGSTTFRQVTNL